VSKVSRSHQSVAQPARRRTRKTNGRRFHPGRSGRGYAERSHPTCLCHQAV